jgi:hypothetical protein
MKNLFDLTGKVVVPTAAPAISAGGFSKKKKIPPSVAGF